MSRNKNHELFIFLGDHFPGHTSCAGRKRSRGTMRAGWVTIPWPLAPNPWTLYYVSFAEEGSKAVPRSAKKIPQ